MHARDHARLLQIMLEHNISVQIYFESWRSDLERRGNDYEQNWFWATFRCCFVRYDYYMAKETQQFSMSPVQDKVRCFCSDTP